eukprot:TRINITY_DN5531_c0_g1_i1.p1 TRINITY_DN5531_c0_g1~~TRINITY_DN5531_c0_g1_i1.p1  ORF type:complete len:441 (+),score=66.22 TRINITY_DN5531_c0_g1_i1:73-1395(+)
MTSTAEGGGHFRRKECAVDLYGARRVIGVIAAPLITDVLSIVRAAAKKRAKLSLSVERVAAVDAELRAATRFDGVDALRVQLKEWQDAYRAEFDANKHYDARRAEAYTSWNEGSQEMLSRRCLELAGLADVAGDGCSFALSSGRERVAAARRSTAKKRTYSEATAASPDTPGSKGVLVDIGCGTGLSCTPAARLGYSVIGCDLATAMLRAPVDVALEGRLFRSDMREGIPVRSGAAAAVTSIGALHFLGEDTTAIANFFADVARVLAGPPCGGGVFCAQFFPSSPAQSTAMVAAAEGAGLWATLVIDQPHRTNGRRTFLIARDASRSDTSLARKCVLYDNASACALSYAHACTQRSLSPRLAMDEPDTHDHWFWREHLRYAHKIVRTRRYNLSRGADTTEAAQPPVESELADRLIDVCGDVSVLEADQAMWPRMFDVLHT